MAKREYITIANRKLVVERARHLCEYCKSYQKYATQSFNIEHIMPIVLGGSSDIENLALACGGCNGHKHTKTTGIDPITNFDVDLFHPRNDNWNEHLEWSADNLK